MNHEKEVRWNDDMSHRKFLVHHPQVLQLSPVGGIRGHHFKFMVTIMMTSSFLILTLLKQERL